MSVHIDFESRDLIKNIIRPKELEYERMLKEAEDAKEQERIAKEQAQAQLLTNTKRTIRMLLETGTMTVEQIAEITDSSLQLILQVKNDTEST